MGKRKAIPKSVRFEVFKRDRFTCQYCGRKSPDVTLEIDHIVPVAEGGTNEPLNLVTACFDCNRGKGKRKLDDTSAVVKQRKALDEIAERQEQARMMIQWKKELMETENKLVDSLMEYWISITGMYLTSEGRETLASYYRRFGYNETYEAIEIAVNGYFRNTVDSAEDAFHKIGGICYNKRKQRLENAEQDY